MADTQYVELPNLTSAIDLHRLLHGRLHLPRRTADLIVRGVKYGINPSQAAIRKRLAGTIAAGLPPAQRIPEEDGYLLLPPGLFPAASPALEAARACFAGLSQDGTIEQTRRVAKKQFLLSIISGTAFLDHPQIMSFMISRPVVDMASVYLGTVPVLASARLWWTPPNQSLQQSQLFHRDGEDDRQIKFFFNLFDVTPEAGPLTFLPAGVSEEVKRRLRYNSGELPDDRIEHAGGRGRHVVATGPADSGVALDTSRCLHFGSRNNSVGRLVLMFQFTSFYAPKAESPQWGRGIGRTGIDLDEVQRLVLGIA